jgi:hypothetical protein
MKVTRDTIELNGKLYNASTGHLLPASKQPKSVVVIKVKAVVDKSAQKKHEVASHLKAHEPVRSQLLMRKAVKKPGKAAKTSRVVVRRIVPAQSIHGRKAEHYAGVKLLKSSAVQHASKISMKNHYVDHVEPEQTQKAPVSPGVAKANALINKALRDARAHEQPRMPKPHRSYDTAKHQVFSRLRIERMAL